MAQRIAVIGAGIAGLATATALLRSGVDVQVYEERSDTSAGTGISIWPNALAALDRIGLGDDVRSAGGRIGAGAMRWRTGAWLRRPSPQRLVAALGEPLVVVQRSVLRDILAGPLPPDRVQWGRGVTALREVTDGIELTLSDSSSVIVDAVVGADGTHSITARHLNGPLGNLYCGYTAWRGVADYRLDPELAGETMGPGRQVGHVPLDDGRTYWFATERTAEGGGGPAAAELAHLDSAFGQWAAPIPQILAATPASQLIRNDLYDRSPARCWARGRMVLVGDAAHPMRPHLGQGGCQGIEDAAVLAACLDADHAVERAFARFAALRRRRVNAIVAESRLIGRMVNARPALLSAAASRATVVIPEAALTRHLAWIAAGSAFRLP